VNPLEVQRILLAYRPGIDNAQEPAVARALAAARQDPALLRWVEEQGVVHTAIRSQFRQLPVPHDLRDRILAEIRFSRERPVLRFPGGGWIAAAAMVLLLGVMTLWDPAPPQPQWADFRGRMVQTVLREYRMDVHTNDMREIRAYLQQQNAPADYRLPASLEAVPLAGGGRLTWQNQPVAMVCFERGQGEWLYLFVIEGTTLPDPPRIEPEFAQVNRLMTASWSADDKSYLLAGEVAEAFLRRFF
jgi:hypothetical protein